MWKSGEPQLSKEWERQLKGGMGTEASRLLPTGVSHISLSPYLSAWGGGCTWQWWHRGSFPLAWIPLFQVSGGAASSSCCTCGTASVSKPLRCSGPSWAGISSLRWAECVGGIRVCRGKGLQAALRRELLAKDGQTKSEMQKKLLCAGFPFGVSGF